MGLMAKEIEGMSRRFAHTLYLFTTRQLTHVQRDNISCVFYENTALLEKFVSRDRFCPSLYGMLEMQMS